MSAAGGAGWYRVPASMMVDRMFSCGPPLRPQSPYLVTVGPNGHPLPLDSDGSPERQRIACMRCCRIQIALDPWGTKAYLCEGELISIEERPPIELWSVPRWQDHQADLCFRGARKRRGLVSNGCRRDLGGLKSCTYRRCSGIPALHGGKMRMIFLC